MSRTQELLNKDRKYISPSYTRDYPFIVAGGRGCRVMDLEGQEYLDFAAGIATCSTGHCHPKVVRAISRQAEKLIHMSGTDFFYENQITLAERLCNLPPGPKDYKWMAYFGNSGAEAIEAAIKLARHATGRHVFIAFTGAFHGRTMGALSLTGSKAIQKKSFMPMGLQVLHAPYPNCFECPFGRKKCDSDNLACVNYLENEIIGRLAGPQDIAGIVVEPIQGEGGYVVPPMSFLPRLYSISVKHNFMLILDEIQSGMGRTGEMFSYQHFLRPAQQPDIICLAKGVASGMPLGVMLARDYIMESWEPGQHASTFGGNPISCAAAHATLDLIQGELMENAEEMSAYLSSELIALATEFRTVRNPRGLGLMQAVDVDNREAVLRNCVDSNLILLGCGRKGIRFCPALTVSKEEIIECMLILREAIREENSE